MNRDNITESLTENQKNAFNDIISAAKNTSDEISERESKKEEFDIADFIVKHSTQYSVKKSKAPRIIAVIGVAVMIIGLCVLIALTADKTPKNPVFGKWVSDKGIEMEIDEDTITIDGSTRNYIFPKGENNVIAISVQNEYFKIYYKLEKGELHIIIPLTDENSQTIIYKRK
jgi:hypothetical protein